jgi:hypothetical protein
MPSLSRHFVPRPARTLRGHRPGRLLIEVLIAMVLLVVGASASATLVRANVTLTERVGRLRSTRAVARQVGEALSVAPCDAAPGATRYGRTEIAWTPSVSGRLVTLSLNARGAAHRAGGEEPPRLTAQLAGWCP